MPTTIISKIFQPCTPFSQNLSLKSCCMWWLGAYGTAAAGVGRWKKWYGLKPWLTIFSTTSVKNTKTMTTSAASSHPDASSWYDCRPVMTTTQKIRNPISPRNAVCSTMSAHVRDSCRYLSAQLPGSGALPPAPPAATPRFARGVPGDSGNSSTCVS